jgi:hypothetical protein
VCVVTMPAVPQMNWRRPESGGCLAFIIGINHDFQRSLAFQVSFLV